jgi:hypothetical protein
MWNEFAETWDIDVWCGRVDQEGALQRKHERKHELGWDAAKQEWFCVRCLQTSDHTCKEDAEHELSYLDCEPPSAPWHTQQHPH